MSPIDRLFVRCFPAKESMRHFLFCMIGIALLGKATAQQALSPQYELDHLIIFVQGEHEQQQFERILTLAEKLETEHTNQGTRGRYFLFLNAFIELMYLEDIEAVRANEALFQSPYSERWSKEAGLQLGFGLRMKPFDTTRVVFPYDVYRSQDAPADEFYVMARGNQDSRQPLVFLTLPHREQPVFASIQEVAEQADPEIRDDFVAYVTHPSGIKSLTGVELQVPRDLFDSENIVFLRSVPGIDVKPSDRFELTLVFDEAAQQKQLVIDQAGVFTIRY